MLCILQQQNAVQYIGCEKLCFKYSWQDVGTLIYNYSNWCTHSVYVSELVCKMYSKMTGKGKMVTMFLEAAPGFKDKLNPEVIPNPIFPHSCLPQDTFFNYSTKTTTRIDFSIFSPKNLSFIWIFTFSSKNRYLGRFFLILQPILILDNTLIFFVLTSALQDMYTFEIFKSYVLQRVDFTVWIHDFRADFIYGASHSLILYLLA